ncbi:MAG TPA: hypothetical protein VF970_01735 [Gemmatimonadales bacterium]
MRYSNEGGRGVERYAAAQATASDWQDEDRWLQEHVESVAGPTPRGE